MLAVQIWVNCCLKPLHVKPPLSTGHTLYLATKHNPSWSDSVPFRVVPRLCVCDWWLCVHLRVDLFNSSVICPLFSLKKKNIKLKKLQRWQCCNNTSTWLPSAVLSTLEIPERHPAYDYSSPSSILNMLLQVSFARFVLNCYIPGVSWWQLRVWDF